jgi:hypothetical protein
VTFQGFAAGQISRAFGRACTRLRRDEGSFAFDCVQPLRAFARLARLKFATGAATPPEGRKRRNKGGLQAFSPSFSKLPSVISKLFRRKLWWFCEISRGCKAG